MSLSITGSNTSNPAAFLPSLLSQDSSASGAVPCSSLSELLASLGQAGGTSSSNASSSTGTSLSSTQLGSQTLQTLLDLQANGSASQSLIPQIDDTGGDSANSTDPISAQQTQPGTEGQRAHRHRHHASGTSTSDMFASAESATSETTANADGSSTTTVTCADGSSMTLTTAALTDSASSTANSRS